MSEPKTLKGVVDSLEKEWALLALDDGQRLDWPRDRLPADATAGSAFVLGLHPADELDAQAVDGTWAGVVGRRCSATSVRSALTGTTIELGDQYLQWPDVVRLAAGTSVVVQMEVDAGDTERRRRDVQNLVDDLFG